MNGDRKRETPVRTRPGAFRGPWAVLCAALTVVPGPAAATAFVLDQATRPRRTKPISP